MAAFMNGCSSDSKDGGVGANVAKVDEALCAQCHSASVETLTGDNIYTSYQSSVHALNSVGCQDCHGGGAMHNGVGPIPFPKPGPEQCKTCHDTAGLVTAYVASKHAKVVIEEGVVCNRCHTHQGAVLAAKFGFTGDGNVMDAEVNAPGLISNPEPIKCNTCHLTHKPQELRVDAGWAPSVVVGAATNTGNAQYKLCTQCHTYINPAGVLAGSGTATSGTVKVGHHETSWYRAIATTHYDNPATAVVEGYGVRATGPNPCFDCHGHESMTNSNNIPGSSSYNAANTTIFTDWAKSGHALGLLTAKHAAATANPVNTSLPRTSPVRVAQGLAQVDAVMAANVPAGPFGGHNSGSCARCHTTDGFAYYMDNNANTPVAVPAGMLKCNGCHTNPGIGTLRTLAGTKFTNYTGSTGWNPSAAFTANGTAYTLNYGKKPYPDVKASNLCISCHDSREKDPGAITPASTNYQRTHYMQAAATMYVKMGFLNLSTGTAGTTNAYIKSLKSSQDGGGITSTHRKLGTPAMIGDHGITAADTALLANGPCVACHLSGGSHTLAIDQKAITAVCNKCHDSEEGHAITTIADFNTYFIEPQSEAYQAALALAIDVFNSKNTGITLYPEAVGSTYVRAYLTGTTTEATTANGANWTTAATNGGYAATINGGFTNATKLMGAVSNVVFLKRDPGAYAHARTYSRRLLYDTIDYLDDGILNLSVGATAIARSLLPLPVSPAISDSTHSTVSGLFTKGAKAFTDATLNTINPGTSEAMIYLIKWDRSGTNAGGWGTPQRP
jgi:hypothetical protein